MSSSREPGSVDRSPQRVAVLLIDFINTMDFEGAEPLRTSAMAAVDPVLRLREEADALEAPMVYVNDNYGLWNAERSTIVEHCSKEEGPARALIERLGPRPDDFFIIKPALSGFYATSLPVLLPKLGVSRLVLTGVAADICVLFTAADAHMRDYDLWVPSDAVGSEGGERTAWALDIMRKSMGAETRPTTELSIEAWVGGLADKSPESVAEKS